MLLNNETITVKGYEGLFHGLLKYGFPLKSSSSTSTFNSKGPKLLRQQLENDDYDKDSMLHDMIYFNGENNGFIVKNTKIPISLIEELFLEYEQNRINKEHYRYTDNNFSHQNGINRSYNTSNYNSNNKTIQQQHYRTKKVARNMNIICDRLRLAFRIATKKTKYIFDWNFDVNIERTRNQQVITFIVLTSLRYYFHHNNFCSRCRKV